MARATADSADRRRQLGFVAFGVLLASADTYVVVVALPSIMAGVGVGLDRLQRATPIISGFLLGYTAVLPLIGRLADLAGVETVLAGCLGAFGVGSVVTATSHALPVVVAGRALQGVGGGGLVPIALSMVAARWEPDRRGLPLGIVGALQELGSVIGPLYGAAVIAVASWRAIFWINLPAIAIVAAGFWALAKRTPQERRTPTQEHSARSSDEPRTSAAGTGRRPRRDLGGPLLGSAGALGLLLALDPPANLANSAVTGQAYAPLVGGAWSVFTTPAALASFILIAAAAVWETAAPFGVRPVLPLRRLAGALPRADLPGALLLAGTLSCVVVAFSTPDPSRQVVASSARVLGPVALALSAVFFLREKRARTPLIPFAELSARPAWGSLVVNLVLGAALMAALVDVPLFARVTADPGSQVGAALELLRFLAVVPIGALAGGALCRKQGRQVAPYVAGAGMVLAAGVFVTMGGWSPTAMGGGPLRASDVELAACGLGFGLAVAPVNLAILGAVSSGFHALASALAVVARTVGMLVGVSVLAAVALHRFYLAEARIGSPLALCPTHPANCPAYGLATQAAVIAELHTIFYGAALCAALAAVTSFWFLRPVAPTDPTSPQPSPSRSARANTESSISAVRRPVKVFCWLGWNEQRIRGRPCAGGTSTPWPKRGRRRAP